MQYPNPFVDDEIPKEPKQVCKNCYKLDRINNRCEKYDVKLTLLVPGRYAVFEKYVECVKAMRGDDQK